MSHKIFVRGLLTGPEYDVEELKSEIDRGIFAPSSKFLRELDEANGEDVQIFLDSEGGDVMSWHQAAQRIKEYPGNIEIVIGACAFSEAANLMLLSERPVKCHRTSIVLFHSAMTPWVEDAGPGELRSEAEILTRINGPVKESLKAHGIPEERVDDGFRDRNALVLGADELVEYGIAELIEGDAAKAPGFDSSIATRLAALAEANQRIAAYYAKQDRLRSTINTSKMDKDTIIAAATADCDEERKQPLAAEDTEEERKEETEEVVEVEKTDETEETPAEEPAEETVEETPAEPAENTENTDETVEEEKPEAGESDDVIDTIIDKLGELAKAVETLGGRIDHIETTAAEEVAKAKAEAESAKQSLKAERTKRIGAMAAVVAAKSNDNGPADWPAAVKLCNGDKLEAYKRYPNLAKAWAK